MTQHRRITGKLVIATHNPGKLTEMRELLAPHGVEAVSAGELGLCEPDESGQTFGANARIKAVAAAKATQLPAFADDSGLVVDALDGGYLRRADIVEIGQLLIGNEGQAGAGSAAARAAPVDPAAASGPGASSGPGLTIFKSVGIAAQDWAVCELAVRRAREAGAITGAPEDGGAVIA